MKNTHNISPKILENLYLIRHGESTCNTFNRLAGKIDVPLTHLGIKQAQEGSKKCEHLSFDKIYVSPLQRAYKTARIVLEQHNLLEKDFFVDGRLKERDFGEFTLENKTKLQKIHGIKEYEKAVNLDSEKTKEAESYEDFSKRVLDFFNDEIVPSLKENKKVIIISHKYVIELLCNIILNKPLNKKFDLRLPNAEVLTANTISKYVRKENEKLTIFKEWLIVNHPVVFLLSFLAGFCLNFFGFSYQTDSSVLLIFLMLATTITLSRINIESSKKFFNINELLLIILRYLTLPLLFVFSIYMFSVNMDNTLLMSLLFLASPTAMIALTISRSVGGFVVPTLIYTILSSLLSIISISLIMGLYFGDFAYISLISFTTIFLSLLVPYTFIFYLRKYKAISTAKFGERNSYLSILFISLFIILVSMNIQTVSLEKLIYVSLVAIVLRFISTIISSNNGINSLDSYISMSYPNIFLLIIIANYLGQSFIQELATLFLVPMFLLSIFDTWYSKRFYLDQTDKRLYSILNIEKNTNKQI